MLRVSTHRASGLVVIVLALAAGACGGTAGSPAASAGSSASSASPATTSAPSVSSPTPVPGGNTVEPVPPGSSFTTTETPWGTILDGVPADFPVYPGAKPTDAPDGPASGAWIVGADAATVSAFYADALAAAGYSNDDRSGPLEDGSYTVDTSSDLPECRIQTTARPQGDTTVIIVMFGAGCVGLG